MNRPVQPRRQGLYDSSYEHDACGVGFVVDLKGRKSHQIIRQGLQILENLEHRGACGCDANMGDGAGILIQMPHAFLKEKCAKRKIDLPEPGHYGVGMVFLPTHPDDSHRCERLIVDIIKEEGQEFLGWRTVPTDNRDLGPRVRAVEPKIRQVFIKRHSSVADEMAFERKLYVIRKRIEAAVRSSTIGQREMFYIPSLSYKTLVYKGMLNAKQVLGYFPDLSDPLMESALALVHSRFSTNTFPNWARAHPYRYIAHNGEINTLRGNIGWMHARETMFRSELFGEDIKKILPIIDESGSDSAMFDNALELLVLAGRSLPHAMMMMIPEPLHADPTMSPEKRAFYEFHACMMEPWDGPASIAFTDGMQIGAVLDRNGLRPSRYYITKDDLVIMASEVGVLDVPPERVLYKGRLQPGKMFLVDLEQGRVIDDGELKHRIATEHPYGEWLERHLIRLEDLPEAPEVYGTDWETLLRRQRAFGYTNEDLRLIMAPMAETANEAIGSMGTDTPLAVLSDKPQLLYNYFKQLFAQVTNPPVDAIREEIIMSMEQCVGGERNLLEPGPESARVIKIKSPILSNEELEKIRALDGTGPGGFKSITLPITFNIRQGVRGLELALQFLCMQADEATQDGNSILILSDRGVNRENAAIPALLAVSAVHHHLIKNGKRTHVGLVLESGEPREVHHFALLIGYGAAAINPYLAFETLDGMIRDGLIFASERSVKSQADMKKGDSPSGNGNGHTNGYTDHAAATRHAELLKKAIKNYIKAANKGVVKVMSKMGVSCVQSYCGAQIFEAIGLNKDLIDKYFTWTASRIGGVGLDAIFEDIKARHRLAFPTTSGLHRTLEIGGQYQWRKDGEFHLFNPESVHKLQYACRTGNYQVFKEYSRLIDDQAERLCTLRGLLRFRFDQPPVPLEEVEPVESIMKRFKSGAMSYGSISQEAHETLAIAMNRIGGKSNTGEGGEDPARYVWTNERGDSKNSAIKQVASGRFGVTSLYLVNAKELQIKMAQGAKPGEGGQLPGHKVYPWIAKVRHSTPGVGLISPPPHHDIYSIEDLAELIHDLKNANPQARISVKLVAEVGVGTIAAGVAKAHADVVLISGHDGGTGASPLTSIKHAGIPWELGLAETHQTLLLNDLRSRIVVEVDGQLKTGRDVVIGALLGAEEFGFATAPLVAMGCILMRVCHLNTCPVGIATQDPRLRAKFTGDPQQVENFMRFVAQEVREIMAQLGFRKFEEMVGRSDRLEQAAAINHFKAKGIDLSSILQMPEEVSDSVGRYCMQAQDHGLDRSLDMTTLLPICRPAIENGEPVERTLTIRNVNRVVGTIVGSEITRRYGAAGLPDDTIKLHFHGSAGQSFGAFIPRGMTLILEGDANDYIGKGLSGGKIIVYPPRASTFDAMENVIIGNVAFYGATSGEAYIDGLAGERFCVRNSGIDAVVLSVGDHGCEYMTGGRVVILGPTGKNFAAGMSGGVAYVLDEHDTFPALCNQEMVQLFRLEDGEEFALVYSMIQKHFEYTQSVRAKQVLTEWARFAPKFWKVYPNDYRRVIETQRRFREQGLSEEEAVMAAFEANAHDAARVGGK